MPKAKSQSPAFIAVADALKLCATIGKSAGTLHSNIQKACAAAIYHANFHKNADVGIRLVETIMATKGVRKNAVVAYLELHGNFKWNAEKKAIEYFRNPEAIAKDEEKLAMLLDANPWDQAKPEAEITSEYDVAGDVGKLLKRIQRAIKDGKELKNIHGTAAEVLVAIAKGESVDLKVVEA